LDKGTFFFEGFNMAVKTAYDRYFGIAEKDVLKGISEDVGLLDGLLSDEIGKWEDTCLSGLDEMTPAQFIDRVDDLPNMMELFRMGAILCDDSLPAVFLKKLQSYGEVSIAALLESSRKSVNGASDEDGFLASQLAVKILGIWKVEQAVIPLIELLYCKSENSELISENVKDALVSIGKPAIPALVQYIESKGFESEAAEYLFMALSEIGEKHKSDKVYKCLKNAFMIIPDKAVGAICLGNYGDGRAIPALRGFLEKNRGAVDKEVFYEVIDAINKLGGNTQDLNL
jgi:hypothetical protein